MKLETDLAVAQISSVAELADALATLSTSGTTRAILSRGHEKYIQAGAYANGYVIERRSGSEDTHMHARHTDGRPPLSAPARRQLRWWQKLLRTGFDLGTHDHAFTAEEVLAIFSAYLEGCESPAFVTWHPGYH